MIYLPKLHFGNSYATDGATRIFCFPTVQIIGNDERDAFPLAAPLDFVTRGFWRWKSFSVTADIEIYYWDENIEDFRTASGSFAETYTFGITHPRQLLEKDDEDGYNLDLSASDVSGAVTSGLNVQAYGWGLIHKAAGVVSGLWSPFLGAAISCAYDDGDGVAFSQSASSAYAEGAPNVTVGQLDFVLGEESYDCLMVGLQDEFEGITSANILIQGTEEWESWD